MTFYSFSRLDVDEIVDFYKSNFSDGWSKTMLISAFESGRFYSLGVKDEEGIVALITYSVAIDQADVEGIVTRFNKRKNGVAEKLYFYAEKDLIRRGVKKVFLEVREGNFPAKNLYNKCGFKDVSVRKNYYSDGENAVVMGKEL